MKKEIFYTKFKLDEVALGGEVFKAARQFSTATDTTTAQKQQTVASTDSSAPVTKQASLEIPIAKSELFIINLLFRDKNSSIKKLFSDVFNHVETYFPLFKNLDNSKKQLLRDTVASAIKKAHEKTNIDIAESMASLAQTKSPKVAANTFVMTVKNTFNQNYLEPLTFEKLKSYYTIMLQKMVKDPKEAQKMLKRFLKDPNKSLQVFKENAIAYINAINKIVIEVLMKVLPQQQKLNLPEHKLSKQQIERWGILAEIKK